MTKIIRHCLDCGVEIKKHVRCLNCAYERQKRWQREHYLAHRETYLKTQRDRRRKERNRKVKVGGEPSRPRKDIINAHWFLTADPIKIMANQDRLGEYQTMRKAR